MDSLTRIAPSKINLYLRISGRRLDGYHDIETLFIPLKSPSDVISVSDSASGLSIISDSKEIPLDSKNICWRAAEAYAEAAGLKPAWQIKILKEIPVTAGMGGGSSDASAVLLLLQKKYGLLDENTLKKTALRLGADLPFFLDPLPSVGRGVGETLDKIKIPVSVSDMPLLIAAPLFPVSAKWSYIHSEWRGREGVAPHIDELIDALEKSDWTALGKSLYNDLGFAVIKKFPLLGLIKDALMENAACGVEVSGSGPTLFAVFRTKKEADDAALVLNEKFEGSVKVYLNK